MYLIQMQGSLVLFVCGRSCRRNYMELAYVRRIGAHARPHLARGIEYRRIVRDKENFHRFFKTSDVRESIVPTSKCSVDCFALIERFSRSIAFEARNDRLDVRPVFSSSRRIKMLPPCIATSAFPPASVTIAGIPSFFASISTCDKPS